MMAETTNVMKLPKSDLVVPAGEKFAQTVFTPEEIRKAVQAGAHLWFEERELCPLAKV